MAGPGEGLIKSLRAGSEAGDSGNGGDGGTPDDNDSSMAEEHLRAMWNACNAGDFKKAATHFAAATTASADDEDSDAMKGEAPDDTDDEY